MTDDSNSNNACLQHDAEDETWADKSGAAIQSEVVEYVIVMMMMKWMDRSKQRQGR